MAAGTTSKKAPGKPAAKPGKPAARPGKTTSKHAAPADGQRVSPKGKASDAGEGTSSGRTSKTSARARIPFPKKNQPPSEAEFLARLPMATGKKFENVRAFLKKQAGVSEDLYYYGPKTGWAYRYRHGASSLGTIMIHDDHLVGIVALDAAALGEVDFTALSDVGERARRLAHGSPSLSWLDLPLDGPGASDFKILLKAKLRTRPEPESEAAGTEAPAGPGSAAPRAAGTAPAPARARAATPPPPPPPPSSPSARSRKERAT